MAPSDPSSGTPDNSPAIEPPTVPSDQAASESSVKSKPPNERSPLGFIPDDGDGPPSKPPTSPTPHARTYYPALAALLISLASATFAGLQYSNAIRTSEQSRKDAAAQAADAERSRKAAEESAEAAKIIATLAERSLTVAERNAQAAEVSSVAAGRLARQMERSATASEALNTTVRRGQSAFLMARVEVNKEATPQAWTTGQSHTLNIENGTQNPALNVRVAYETRTVPLSSGNANRFFFRLQGWRTIPPHPETVDDYRKAIEKLEPKVDISILPSRMNQPVGTFPAPMWFTIPPKEASEGLKELSDGRKPTLTLMPAVVLGFIVYDDYANRQQKVLFCLPLSDDKVPPCSAANVQPQTP